MLAVTMIVLTSGGVSTARLIGSAGVGLALTVLPERASKAPQVMPEVGDRDGWDVLPVGAVASEDGPVPSDVRLMASLGLIDLPPPAVL